MQHEVESARLRLRTQECRRNASERHPKVDLESGVTRLEAMRVVLARANAEALVRAKAANAEALARAKAANSPPSRWRTFLRAVTSWVTPTANRRIIRTPVVRPEGRF